MLPGYCIPRAYDACYDRVSTFRTIYFRLTVLLDVLTVYSSCTNNNRGMQLFIGSPVYCFIKIRFWMITAQYSTVQYSTVQYSRKLRPQMRRLRQTSVHPHRSVRQPLSTTVVLNTPFEQFTYRTYYELVYIMYFVCRFLYIFYVRCCASAARQLHYPSRGTQEPCQARPTGKHMVQIV